MSLWRRNRALSKLLLSVLARGPKKFRIFSRQPHDWTDWRKLETKMPQIREQACLICRKQGSIQRCPSYSPPCWEVGQRNLFLFRQNSRLDWMEENRHQNTTDSSISIFDMSLTWINTALPKLLPYVMGRRPKKFSFSSRQPDNWTDWTKNNPRSSHIQVQAS